MQACLAMSPVVDIFGVFVDGWIIAGLAGLIVAFVVMLLLFSWSKSRYFAESALLFCSVAATSAIVIWWFVF